MMYRYCHNQLWLKVLKSPRKQFNPMFADAASNAAIEPSPSRNSNSEEIVLPVDRRNSGNLAQQLL
jgi:hypothetical protein